MLGGPGVQFIGEINEQEKTDFLGQALALMFMIDWPEPFGLTMIEAMACGTPVLACRRGSVEEVVDDGLTGHIVDSIDEAIVTLPRVMALDRRAVRRRFEERFTATRMAKDYLRVYKSLPAGANVKLVPSQAEPSRAEPSRAEPSRAEPSRAEPSRAEPSRAEPSRAEPSRASALDRCGACQRADALGALIIPAPRTKTDAPADVAERIGGFAPTNRGTDFYWMTSTGA